MSFLCSSSNPSLYFFTISVFFVFYSAHWRIKTGSLREAQPCRYCFYSVSQKWVFPPAGATRCPDKGEIWHGERTTSVPNFPLYRRKNVGTQPSKLWKCRILPINLHLRGHSFPQLLRNSQLLYGCLGRFWLFYFGRCRGTIDWVITIFPRWGHFPTHFQ